MIEVVEEIELAEFPFWAGAEEVAEEINRNEEAQACWEYLEEIISSEGRAWTAREVNDFIWFDAGYLLVEAGYFENEDQRGAFGLLLFFAGRAWCSGRIFVYYTSRKSQEVFYENLKKYFFL